MVFSEVYGSYFNAVAAILKEATEEKLTDKRLSDAVQKHAFGESILTIPQALKDQSWPLLDSEGASIVANAPTMPLTLLQKRWLKALLSDPRIQLFAPSAEGLENVEPLYEPGTFVYFDKYNDGDPYEDDIYIKNFRTILTAVEEKRKLRVRFKNRNGTEKAWVIVPYSLEYSAKDDKFRVISANGSQMTTVNVARISSCELLDKCSLEAYSPVAYREKSIVFELTDTRNALERVMLHFSHLEKETERIDEKHYRVTLYYQQGDETELLIRILSFGPVIRVIEPESFIDRIRERLSMQNRFENQ